MDSNEIRVDVRSMEDFKDRLAPRLRQVATALSTLSRAEGPALGHFHHARRAEQRYEALHAEFVARARRLLAAMVVSQAGVRSIAAAFGDRQEFHNAKLRAITDALLQASPAYRAAVLDDAGLDATLFQEAARYEALLASAAARRNTVVDGGETSA